MSILVVNPPFKFENSLVELNSLFKPVEKFEVIHYSESLSRSTNYCFNLIGSICSYISTKNHTDQMIERYAIIENTLRENLKQYKIKIDEIAKNIKEKITMELDLFRKEVNVIIVKLKCKYRKLREDLKEKLKIDKFKIEVKKELRNIYLRVKEVIKITLDTFKDIYSNFNEYTRLNDEYLDMERRYINLVRI